MYWCLFIYWLLFGVLHSLLAAEKVKHVFHNLMRGHFRYYRFYYSILSFLLLAWILYYQYSHTDRRLFNSPTAVVIAAILLMVPALLVMAVSIRKYFFYLSGIDVFFPSQHTSARLETGGLNRFVRHPLYSGTILLVTCLWMISPTIGNTISTSMVIVYTCVGCFFEEKKLRREFGEAYKIYQQHTPMLIPFTKAGNKSSIS